MSGHSNVESSPRTDAPRLKARAAIALLLLVPFPSLGTAASMSWWPGTTLGYALFIFGKVWIVVLPLIWLLWVERGTLSWSPPQRGGFGVAAVLGLIIAA